MFAAAVAGGQSGVIIIIGDQVVVNRQGSSGLATLWDYVNGLRDYVIVLRDRSVVIWDHVWHALRWWVAARAGYHVRWGNSVHPQRCSRDCGDGWTWGAPSEMAQWLARVLEVALLTWWC